MNRECGDRVDEQRTLDDFYAFVQRLFVVVGAYVDGHLGENRSGIHPRIDQVHGGAGDSDAVRKGITYAVSTRERR